MDIISHQEALKSGAKHYFTGLPCKRGHITLRYTKSAMCVTCDEERRQVKIRNRVPFKSEERICAYTDCYEVFIATRYNQVFCSDKCRDKNALNKKYHVSREEKVCICGKVFMALPTTKYCSLYCLNKADYERRKIRISNGIYKHSGICKQCSKHFEYEYIPRKRLFCSRECYGLYITKKKPLVYCDFCNKLITRDRFRFDKNEAAYCNNECQWEDQRSWLKLAKELGTLPKNPGSGVSTYVTKMRKLGLMSKGEGK